MKKYIIIFILLLLFCVSIYADFIVPVDDPVYPFLEFMSSLGYGSSTLLFYPAYHSTIMDILADARNQNLPSRYLSLVEYHYERLSLSFPEDLSSAVYPISKIPVSAKELLQPHSAPKHLVTYKKDETAFFLSGMLGFHYDFKFADNDFTRRYDYYGLYWGGNIKQNFGFSSYYRKGHYVGDEPFILEDPHLHLSGGEWRLLTTHAEIDFKNPYLNLSSGFGTFQLGKTISSSIFLNSDITPFGYFKYYKDFGNIHYIGFISQLTPDSLATTDTSYANKSYALQTVYYANDLFSFGIGEAALYSDNTLDLAYASPLVIFKLVDFKTYGRDNILMFVYGTLQPFKRTTFYGNFLVDDLKKSRLFKPERFTSLAGQVGALYNFHSIPLQLGVEVTAVGPVTYSHRTNHLCYTHDTQLLGYQYGSNLLNLATRIRYVHPLFNISFFYENMQQGNVSNDPFVMGDPAEFLAGDLSRMERITCELAFYPIPEFNINVKFKYKKVDDEIVRYLFTGVEFKY